MSESVEEPPRWIATAPPLEVNGKDEDRARAVYLHTLAVDPSQIEVAPANAETA